MNIVNVGYDSTNYYVLADSQSRLLIDIGWPGTLPRLRYHCQRTGIDLGAVGHLLVTHFHPDHGGLVQELKQLGMNFILMESQLTAVSALKHYMKPEHHYVDVELHDNVILTFDESRHFLEGIGIQGQIIPTRGHSEDSISLILDSGEAFTGDLLHPMMLNEDTPISQQSWDLLRECGARQIYPGHGPIWALT